MNPHRTWSLCLVGGLLLLLALVVMGAPLAVAQDDPRTIKLGKNTLTAPEDWEARKPKSPGIVMYEFAAPADEKEETAGRVTIGPLGGGLEQNVARWYAQVKQPDGGDTQKRAKVDKKTIAGYTVHIIDMAGTYLDRNFQTGETAELPDHRLFVVALVGKEGSFYVKFYGPKRTIDKHEKAFLAMIDGLK
jgi:hypothetical protein